MIKQAYEPKTGGFGYINKTRNGTTILSTTNLLGALALNRDIERAAERALLKRIEGCPIQTLKYRFIEYPKI